MPVAVPLGFLNMLFRYHGAARTMKSRAVDQTGLKGLELLAGNDMIVNVDNHDAILSMRLGLLPIRDRQRAARQRRKDWSDGVTGVVECWFGRIVQYSITPLHHSMGFSSAAVASGSIPRTSPAPRRRSRTKARSRR